MSFATGQSPERRAEELIVLEPPSGQPPLNTEPSSVGNGPVRNDVSTALVRLYRQLFGRGPARAATYEFDAGYVTFLGDVLAPHERRLVLSGRADLVRETRRAIREAECERLIAEIQRLTGRPVLHDSFQLQPERNLAIELFWAANGSADGAGNTPAFEATAPTRSRYGGVMSDGER